MQQSNFPGNVRQGMSSFVIGNKAYVGLGWDFATFYTDFWEYDPVTNSWTQIANFPGDGRQNAAAFSIGNKGYVGTGYKGNNTTLKDFWEYDPSTNNWIQKADFGGSARSGAVGFALNGIGYIGTGTGSPLFLNDMWAYNPVTNTWIKKNDFGGLARRYASCFVIDNVVYIGTGQGPTEYTGSFYQYNATSDTWTQKTDYPVNRSNCASFVVGGEGYIGTGYYGAGYTNTFYKYTPSTDSWAALPDFSGGKRSVAIGFAVNGQGYVCGGYGYAIGVKNDLWKYDMPLGQSCVKINASCYGDNNGSITITAFGGKLPYKYYWSPNVQDTTNHADSLIAGTYTVKIKDSANDSVVVIINISQPSQLTAFITANDSLSFCQGDSVKLTSDSAKSYLWNSNDTSRSITVFTSGNYSVTITDSNGCLGTSLITAVNVNPLPVAQVIPNSSASFCEGDSVILMASTANSYVWNNNKTLQSITVSTAGDYWVRITDSLGCSDTSEIVTIISHPLPDKPTISALGNMLTSSATKGNHWYLNGNPINAASSQLYTYNQNGSYTVVVTDSNGCQATSDPHIVANVGINGIESDEIINVFPNPSNGSFRIETGGEILNNLKIFDLIGQLIYASDAPPSVLCLNNEGVFTLRIETKNQVIIKKLLIKF